MSYNFGNGATETPAGGLHNHIAVEIPHTAVRRDRCALLRARVEYGLPAHRGSIHMNARFRSLLKTQTGG
jgi:hypothetical protein